MRMYKVYDAEAQDYWSFAGKKNCYATHQTALNAVNGWMRARGSFEIHEFECKLKSKTIVHSITKEGRA